MNDITFLKTFCTLNVTKCHCYLLCGFKVHPLHEPSGSPTVMSSDLPSATSLAILFFDQIDELNTDCAFRACLCLMLKHVGIILFKPICTADDSEKLRLGLDRQLEQALLRNWCGEKMLQHFPKFPAVSFPLAQSFSKISGGFQ